MASSPIASFQFDGYQILVWVDNDGLIPGISTGSRPGWRDIPCLSQQESAVALQRSIARTYSSLIKRRNTFEESTLIVKKLLAGNDIPTQEDWTTAKAQLAQWKAWDDGC